MKNNLHTWLLASVFLLGNSMGMHVFGDDKPEDQQVTSLHPGNTPHSPGLPSVWKGRNISELVATLGEPDMVLKTAVRGFVIYGATHSVLYVYFPNLDSGNLLYDAYVVEHDSGEILAYQRRS